MAMLRIINSLLNSIYSELKRHTSKRKPNLFMQPFSWDNLHFPDSYKKNAPDAGVTKKNRIKRDRKLCYYQVSCLQGLGKMGKTLKQLCVRFWAYNNIGYVKADKPPCPSKCKSNWVRRLHLSKKLKNKETNWQNVQVQRNNKTSLIHCNVTDNSLILFSYA